MNNYYILCKCQYTYIKCVRTDVLIAATMKIIKLYTGTSRSLVHGYGTYILDYIIYQTRGQLSSYIKLAYIQINERILLLTPKKNRIEPIRSTN